MAKKEPTKEVKYADSNLAVVPSNDHPGFEDI